MRSTTTIVATLATAVGMASLMAMANDLGTSARLQKNQVRATPPSAHTLPAAGGQVCGDFTLSHSLDRTILQGNSVACGGGPVTLENSYYRAFETADFDLGLDFAVCAVSFAVEAAESQGQVQPIRILLYDTTDLTNLNDGTLIGDTEFELADQARTWVTIPLETTTNTGQITVEVMNPDGSEAFNRFFIGSNNGGQTGPSYLRAPACGATEPTDLADIGFPGMHVLIEVHGTPAECELPGGTLYSVAQGDDLLRTINPLTGQTLTETTINVLGFDPGAVEVLGGNGLATHPETNELFAVLRVTFGKGGERFLATIDPDSGDAAFLGILGERFAGLAFGTNAELYGVTGDGASQSESLFHIDQSNAETSFVCHFGNGDDGETIAYNPLDETLYHASGLDDVVFERFTDEGTASEDCTMTNIDISNTPLADGEAQALTWWPGEDVFLWKRDYFFPGPLFRVTPEGEATLIGDLDHQAKGLAFIVDDITDGGTPGDCNDNGIEDACDIQLGISVDCNLNGIPDECDTEPVYVDPNALCADECEDAPLVCPGIIYNGHNFDAGPSKDLALFCGLFFGVYDVYCKYVPAYSGTAFIRVEGPRDVWVYSLHTGCPTTDANFVDCNDTDHFEIVFDAVAGQEYYVRVAAFGFLRGVFEMNLVGPPCLLNENDANGNGVPDECECPADVNGDGIVDLIDLGIVSASQGPCPVVGECPADVDGNGVVDSIDGMIVASSLGPCPNRDR